MTEVTAGAVLVDITGRDADVVAEALALAATIAGRLPTGARVVAGEADYRLLLSALVPDTTLRAALLRDAEDVADRALGAIKTAGQR